MTPTDRNLEKATKMVTGLAGKHDLISKYHFADGLSEYMVELEEEFAKALSLREKEVREECLSIMASSFRSVYDGENEHAKICYVKMDKAIRQQPSGMDSA